MKAHGIDMVNIRNNSTTGCKRKSMRFLPEVISVNSWILGRRFFGYSMLLTIIMASGNVIANELISLAYENNPNGGEFSLDLTETIDEPRVFATDEPPRLIIELPDTYTELPASPIRLDNDTVRSYTTISDGTRTRVIVDLKMAHEYDLSFSGSQVSVVLSAATEAPVASSDESEAASAVMTAVAEEGTVDSMVAVAAEQPRAVAVSQANNEAEASSNKAQLLDIDFRRTPIGGGRVILDLSNDAVSSAVNQRGQQLQIDLFNTVVPASMERVLDVVDFATPVMRITTSNSVEGARTTLEIAGEYTHEAFLDGEQFIVEISPLEVELEESDDITANLFQNREYVGDRVTFNFQDIPVRSVLQLIADVSDLNIVVSDSVVGNVTLRLTNVPWDQALDLVLDTKNLDKRRNGNVIWVAPADEISAREQQLLQAQQDKIQLEPLNSVILDVSYAEAEALAEIIQSTAASAGTDGSVSQGLLSSRGSVTVDQRTNTLLLTDTRESLENVRQLVQRLDRPVRQVLIESRIVIATDDFSHELGVRFGITSSAQDDNGSLFTTSGSIDATDQTNNLALRNRLALGGSGQNFPNFVDDPTNGAGIIAPSLDNRLNVNLPAAGPAGSLGFSILAADYLLDLELSALETEGRGEVISTPRVVTANQAEAFIQQGVEIPFQQASSSGATNIQFRDAVLELRATPLITPDDRVQLTLSVKQDTVGEIVPTGDGGTAPSIDTTELGTQVLVENGETIVLGGIFQETTTYSNEKVPFLGDVPVLGVLFRRRGTENDKSELLIFVTPTILDERLSLPTTYR